jgi:hypothetical protein
VTSSTTPTGSSPANVSESEAPTPIYDALAHEIGDPELASREADEFLIRWHLAHPREE